ncbi:MAG: superoxide dismutase [Chloroflexi bacterium]|nr:superoxide dismutase [Chloroflexota bacterium]
MRILAIERETPSATAEQFKPHLKAEAARVWALYESGIIREIYFDEAQHTAVILLECASLEAARQALESLPLVQLGLIEFEIIRLIPYTGFARLFEP